MRSKASDWRRTALVIVMLVAPTLGAAYNSASAFSETPELITCDGSPGCTSHSQCGDECFCAELPYGGCRGLDDCDGYACYDEGDCGNCTCAGLPYGGCDEDLEGEG
jgi:hypothetical protein